MAVTKNKTVKKVSTAKGKGKVAVKRAPKVVKEVDPNKYGRFVIEDAFTEKYPTMVVITKAPAAYSDLLGKKYVSRERFITFIETEKAEVAISKGAKAVKEELIAAGLAGIDAE